MHKITDLISETGRLSLSSLSSLAIAKLAYYQVYKSRILLFHITLNVKIRENLSTASSIIFILDNHNMLSMKINAYLLANLHSKSVIIDILQLINEIVIMGYQYNLPILKREIIAIVVSLII